MKETRGIDFVSDSDAGMLCVSSSIEYLNCAYITIPQSEDQISKNGPNIKGILTTQSAIQIPLTFGECGQIMVNCKRLHGGEYRS